MEKRMYALSLKYGETIKKKSRILIKALFPPGARQASFSESYAPLITEGFFNVINRSMSIMDPFIGSFYLFVIISTGLAIHRT